MKQVRLGKTQWIDFFQPNADDILEIRKKYNLHPLVVEEFSMPTIRPKAAEYENCLYLAIHIPLYDVKEKTSFPAEVDIAIADDTLITAHDQDIYQLKQFFETLQENNDKRKYFEGKSPGFLLHYIIEMLWESCFPKIDHMAEKLEYIEEQIFSGNEKAMVFEISVVKRDILNFRRIMKPQRSIIESLSQREFKRIESELKPYYQDLIGTNIRIWNTLESLKETIESLEETNNSLLSNKLNLTMKILTIFSAVMLPMTVYSNILAMSADIPFGDHPQGFWIHISIMIFISFITMFIFKIKKWL